MKRALIVFAKVPEPGRVKTRLTGLLSPEWAAALYEAFLRDALAQYVALGVDVRLYVSPPVEGLPDDLVPAGVSIHEQHGDGLGARMQHAFVETFLAGYPEAVIIGTDHPTLPDAFILQAFEALVQPYAISIGPSEDGGYYLLGMNEFYPVLFRGMSYSHDQVFAQTLDRIRQTDAQLSVLPLWYDVDTPESLERLLEELENEEDVGRLEHTKRLVLALRSANLVR